MKTTKLLVLILLLILSGCNNGRPTDRVYGTTNLEVYAVKFVDTNKTIRQYGKYEYWVSDGSTQGWVMITNDKYNIGDTLEITRKTVEK